MAYFINISNHPSSGWQTNQLKAAETAGAIYDIPFPVIPPQWGNEEVAAFVGEYMEKVKELLPQPDGVSVIHVMGESVFTFMLVTALLTQGYVVVASTTERVVAFEGDKKTSFFKFVRFRSYNLP